MNRNLGTGLERLLSDRCEQEKIERLNDKLTPQPLRSFFVLKFSCFRVFITKDMIFS